MLLVVALVGVAYWPVLHVRSVVSDDFEYMIQNPLVRAPSWASAGQFLREVTHPSTVHGHYQPLTMISLMLDCAMGGGPGNLAPFRRTSFVLHLANAAMVTLLVYLLFGRPWPAVLVGLLFGLHPVTVETVAWLSDRKTILGAFFGFATLLAYISYARSGRWPALAGAFALYVLAVLAKGAAMPLAGVLLLLDYWPLRRLSLRAALEKVPFFLVAAASAAITLISHDTVSPARMPWETAHMPLVPMLCRNLLFYPLEFALPLWVAPTHDFPQPPFLADPLTVAGLVAAVLVPAGLLLALRWTRAPLTGWLIYVALIFPVLGIVGFMDVVAADRHLYISMIGLLLIAGWALSTLWGGTGRRNVRAGVVAALLILLVTEAAAMRRYLWVWQDTERVHRYAAEHAPRAVEPAYNLGIVLAAKGKLAEAVECYTRAIELRPDYWPAHSNLAQVYAQLGDTARALRHNEESLRLNPENHLTHNSLANLLVGLGRNDEALEHFHEALRLAPRYVTARVGLANLLAQLGRNDEAIEQYGEAVRLAPDDYRPRLNFGLTLAGRGRVADALEQFAEVTRLQPDFAAGHLYRARAADQLGRRDEAIAAYRRTLELEPKAQEVRARLQALNANPHAP